MPLIWVVPFGYNRNVAHTKKKTGNQKTMASIITAAKIATDWFGGEEWRQQERKWRTERRKSFSLIQWELGMPNWGAILFGLVGGSTKRRVDDGGKERLRRNIQKFYMKGIEWNNEWKSERKKMERKRIRKDKRN